ncbi:MAG: hypothetical protein AB8G96_10420, partial [Phycisphaerales bacterium]
MSRSFAWPLLAISACFNVFFAIGYVRAEQPATPRVDPLPVADQPATSPNGQSTDRNAADGTGRRNGARGGANDSPRDGERAGRHRGRADGGSRDERRTPAMVLREVTRLLELDEDQRSVFSTLQSDLLEDEQVFGMAIDTVRAGMKQRLMNFHATPDDHQIQDALANEVDLVRQRQLARADRFEEFTKVLRPEQMERLRTAMANADRESAQGRSSRFDTNGDGQIDGTELEAMRERLNERRKQWQADRAEMERQSLQLFDANGDGQLTGEEREAARNWNILRWFDANRDGVIDDEERKTMEERRGRRGRGGGGGGGGGGG